MELSDAPEALLSTAREICVCVFVRKHACVFLHVMDDLVLHGKVRNMPSFSSSSTKNSLNSWI